MKKILCVALIFLLMISVFGCKASAKKNKYTDYSFDYFDTVTTIIGYETSEEDFKAVCEEIKEKLSVYHQLYTIYNKYDGINNLASLNEVSSGTNKATEVDKKIIDLLEFSKDMYYQTNGKVNIALGSVLSIWHRYRTNGINNPENAELPKKSELLKAGEHTNIEDLIINSEKNTVLFKDKEMKLDVGAIAKGYAAERVAKWMKSENINGYILNIGGNVRAVGKKPDGTKWKIGVENPDTANEEKPYIEYLEIEDMSLVTSGSYQRYYIVDGKSYHHIIDNETLMPADNFLSVSVLCEDSGKADAFSTALFCTTYEEGKKLVESIKDLEAMWVLKDGTKYYSDGFKDYIV